MIKHASVHITFALIIGIILGRYLGLPLNFSWILIAVGFVVLIMAYLISNKFLKPQLYFTLISLLMLVFIGVGRVSSSNTKNYKDHYTHHLKEKNTVVLSVKSILKPSAKYHKYEAEVQQVGAIKTKGKLLLNIKKDSFNKILSVGQYLLSSADILEIDAPKNPYQFNYKKYLENRQIYTQIYTTHEDVKILNKHKKSIYSLAASFRKKVISKLIDKGLKGDELAVVEALLLGERNQISSSLRESYVAAGAIHILAISGLHIGIIMMLISFILKPLDYLKNGKNVKVVLIILALWIYAIIAGLSPSVIRAVTMFTAISIGLFSHRKIDIYNILAISAFFLLLINPSYLFNVGFQMSYLAVIAIIAIQSKIAALWQPKYKVINYFWQLTCVSLAAQIGVVPLSLFYFHQFPGLFFLTNIVIIPVLGLILGFGLLIILLAALNILPEILLYYYQFIIRYLNLFVAWVSQQEDFIFKNISFPFVLMLVSYLAILSLYFWRTRKTISSIYLTCFAILSLQFVVFYESYTASNSNKFIVFDNYKEPFIAIKRGQELQLLSKNSNDYLLNSYRVGAQIKHVIPHNTLQNIYMIEGQKILIIDENGVFEPLNNVETVILTKSPKINLQRLIEKLNPQLIIADGSNYKSSVKLWKNTCKKLHVEFYTTTKDGAYIYDF